MNAIAISVHGVLATIWIGGMFFAYLVMRPAAGLLEPHRRLVLWNESFLRFFPWVWAAVWLLPVTGYWLMYRVFGGFSGSPMYVHLMHALGLIMFVVFGYLYFKLLPSFRQAVTDENWAVAGSVLNKIRQLVLINLLLGLSLLVIVYSGRYGFSF